MLEILNRFKFVCLIALVCVSVSAKAAILTTGGPPETVTPDSPFQTAGIGFSSIDVSESSHVDVTGGSTVGSLTARDASVVDFFDGTATLLNMQNHATANLLGGSRSIHELRLHHGHFIAWLGSTVTFDQSFVGLGFGPEALGKLTVHSMATVNTSDLQVGAGVNGRGEVHVIGDEAILNDDGFSQIGFDTLGSCSLRTAELSTYMIHLSAACLVATAWSPSLVMVRSS